MITTQHYAPYFTYALADAEPTMHHADTALHQLATLSLYPTASFYFTYLCTNLIITNTLSSLPAKCKRLTVI